MRDGISRFLTYLSLFISFGLFLLTYAACLWWKIELLFYELSLLVYPLIGTLVGWTALALAKSEKAIARAKQAKNAGLLFAVVFLGLFLISLPSWINLKVKAGNAEAKSTKRNIELSEENYFEDHGKYTGDMEKLLPKEQLGEPAPGVTFMFLHVSASGFSGYTQHAEGNGITFFFQGQKKDELKN